MKQQNNKLSFRLKTISMVLILASGLSACASMEAPKQNTKETLGLSQEISERYSIDEAWWKAYGDEQLNRLIDLALKNNTDLAISAIKVNQALYQANLAGADLTPTLSGSLRGSVDKNLKDGGNSKRGYGGSIGVSYEVDLWQKLADSQNAKVWAYQASFADKEALKLSTVYAVMDVYFQLSALQAEISNAEQTITVYQQLLDITNSKWRLGRVAAIEPRQAEQSLLNAKNQLISLKKQYSQSQQALANLVNERLDTANQHFNAENINKIQPLGVDLSVPVAVIANRPDLRASEYRLQQSFKSWQSTSKSWYPSISLSAVVSSSDENIGSALKFPIGVGSVNINLPFLDWQKVKWNIKISEADYEVNRLNFENNIVVAVNEVIQNHYLYQQALQMEANLEAKVKAEEKIAKYYQVRYNNGKEEFSKWLSAQNSLNDTRLSLIKSRYERIKAENTVYKSMAGRYSETISM